MRISDWSSDVYSSDLRIQEELARAADAGGHHRRAAGHGLEGHQAEGLLPLAGEDERIGGPVSLHQARSVDRPELHPVAEAELRGERRHAIADRKSTRLNSSH